MPQLTRAQIVAIVKTAYTKGQIPDLSRLDLCGLDLSKVSLVLADFGGASLCGINF